MDTLIIEHLACLEINRIILQEPYQLVSEVQFNDKSPCFDGEIIVYNSDELKKENIEDTVKVQIKGTTLFKKIKGNSKIGHPVHKTDLEAYKKTGKGVLYLVVTINKKNKKMQTFYKALTPLEIERLLSIIEQKKQDSLTIDFKMFKDGDLEHICRAQIKNVRKQPSNFIELSKQRDYETYKIEYDVIPSELKEFSLFDNVAYIYGVEGDFEYPVKATIPDSININGEENIILSEEETNIKYNVTESRDEITILFEETLKFTFSKKRKKGKLNIERLITLESYLKSLKLLKDILEKDELPFETYKITASINEKGKFQNLNEEIEQYNKLLNVCKRIGINGDYRFNEAEDLEHLFNSIHSIFYKKNYKAIKGDLDVEQEAILRLELSGYITLLLYKDSKDNLYYNMFDEDIFSNVRAFISKNPGESNPNKDDYYKTSVYSPFKIQDLLTVTNFNYEIYEKSFKADIHEKSSDYNIQISLELITVYDETKESKYLDLAERLLRGLMESTKESDVIKLNILQIKKRAFKQLEKHEEDFLYDILERENDRAIKFVASVILGLKIPAERLLKQMNDAIKKEVIGWPIYNLFLEI
ncbi:hypothetical protein CON22_24760 [Bacillus cereus]|nr:hypothetical protein CON22_24760 [Bacillus cereus]